VCSSDLKEDARYIISLATETQLGMTINARNLDKVLVKNYRDFNTMDVLRCDNIVMSRSALEKLPERFR
jgi:thymidylate synthase ThyX